MARLSKRDWLERGLHMLGEVGANSLTIDLLTTELGVTKGSFYHHFKNMEAFKLAMLEFYESEGTVAVIDYVEAAPDARQKLYRLLGAMVPLHPNTEPMLRAWAMQDDDVREFQGRVDQQRLDYVRGLVGELIEDDAQADMLSKTLMTVYIGGVHMLPRMGYREMSELLQSLLQQYGIEEDT